VKLLPISILILVVMAACVDAPNGTNADVCNLAEETETLKVAREALHACTTMSLVRLKDNQYDVKLSVDEVEAVKALVQQKNLKISSDPGPSVAITYRIRAGDITWGMLHNGLVLYGPTRETSESRRYRYEHAELDFGTPGPGDFADGWYVDEHVRASLRQLVELHKSGKLD
jgi:hypothetical protein